VSNAAACWLTLTRFRAPDATFSMIKNLTAATISNGLGGHLVATGWAAHCPANATRSRAFVSPTATARSLSVAEGTRADVNEHPLPGWDAGGSGRDKAAGWIRHRRK